MDPSKTLGSLTPYAFIGADDLCLRSGIGKEFISQSLCFREVILLVSPANIEDINGMRKLGKASLAFFGVQVGEGALVQ